MAGKQKVLTKEEQFEYDRLQRKFTKGIELFYCEKDHCWLTEKGCINRQLKAADKRKSSLNVAFPPQCPDCAVSTIMQKLFNKDITFTVVTRQDPESSRTCVSCGHTKKLKDFPKNAKGRYTGRVCRLCTNEAIRKSQADKELKFEMSTVTKHKIMLPKIKEFFKKYKKASQADCARALSISESQVHYALHKKTS